MSTGFRIKEYIDLTQQLVRIPSVNGTLGECHIADYVEQWLKNLPYFRQYPHHVWTQELPGDPLGRKNVFALIKGSKNVRHTVILHGHMDTVGAEDFGALQEIAFDSEALRSALLRHPGVSEDIKSQALSGEWLFGRGALDMKSGLAVQLKLVEAWSRRAGDLPGHVLFMANPVEENQHTGIIAALTELLRLKAEEQLEYLCAINSDYVTAYYPGDPNRYVYTGATGKLLLNVFIKGRETHVGEAFSGFDPLLVLAECLQELNYNPELADRRGREVSQPPVALYARDLKPSYNVQTAGAALLYLNWFTLASSPAEVLNTAKARIQSACARAVGRRNRYAELHSQLASPHDPLRSFCPGGDIPVLTFGEWVAGLEPGAKRRVETVLQSAVMEPDTDQREAARQLVEQCFREAGTTDPLVLLYYTSPFCPQNYLREDVPAHREVLRAVSSAVQAVGRRHGEPIEIRQFFPYLSDSSYLNMMDNPEGVETFIKNFPGWGTMYQLPLDQIRELSIPAINLGVYGFDAHKWTERVYVPYSFGVLPELIWETVMELWKNSEEEQDS